MWGRSIRTSWWSLRAVLTFSAVVCLPSEASARRIHILCFDGTRAATVRTSQGEVEDLRLCDADERIDDTCTFSFQVQLGCGECPVPTTNVSIPLLGKRRATRRVALAGISPGPRLLLICRRSLSQTQR